MPSRFASCGPESGQAVFTMDAVYGAYRACRRRKRKTRNAQRYEIDLLDQLVNTVHALAERTWRPSRTIAFVVRHPKPERFWRLILPIVWYTTCWCRILSVSMSRYLFTIVIQTGRARARMLR